MPVTRSPGLKTSTALQVPGLLITGQLGVLIRLSRRIRRKPGQYCGEEFQARLDRQHAGDEHG